MLPATADATRFWIGLEHIRDTTGEELKRRRARYFELAAHCAALIAAELPLLSGAQLQQQRDDLIYQADLIGRHAPRWRFWRLFALVGLAQRYGIDLGYSSPRRSGKPTGPGIDYMLSASEMILAPVRADRARKLIEIYGRWNVGAKLAGAGGLKADGTVLEGLDTAPSDPA
jgi:hypothetical protein